MAKPYVAPPEFMAYPNYLDLDDLIPGGNQAQQQAELFNSGSDAYRCGNQR